MADYDLFTDLTAALAAAEAVFAANFGGLMSAVSLDGSNAAKSLHWNKRKLVLMDIDPAKFSDGSDAVAPKTIDEMSVTEKAAACFVLEPLFQSLSEMSTERLEKVAQAFSGGAVTIRVDNAEPILRSLAERCSFAGMPAVSKRLHDYAHEAKDETSDHGELGRRALGLLGGRGSGVDPAA